jgi:hypothetical protein
MRPGREAPENSNFGQQHCIGLGALVCEQPAEFCQSRARRRQEFTPTSLDALDF